MESPIISFIVAIYNVEPYLKRCVISLQKQTINNIEIILVDDESSDHCPQMCDEYAKQDNRIKVIHKKNEGLGLARNSGLDLASGQYVYFVDADDYLEPNTVEKLATVAKKQDADICIGGYFAEKQDGSKILIENRFTGKTYYQKEIVHEILKEMLGEPDVPPDYIPINMSVWQGIYSLSWIRKNHLRFQSERQFVSEDIIFHLSSLPLSRKFVVLPGGYYHHILDNPDSLTNQYNPERFHKVCILYEKEKQKIYDLNLDPSFVERTQSTYLGNVRHCLKLIVQHMCIAHFIDGYQEVKSVINNQTLQQVLKEYPYKETRKNQRLYSAFLRKRSTFFIVFFTKIFLLFNR